MLKSYVFSENMDRLVCHHADEDPKLDSRNSSIARPIRLPRRNWNASKQKQRFATRVQRSSTGILNQSLKCRPIPYSGCRTRRASERFQVRGRSPSCFFRKNTEESFRRNSTSRERASKLPERCHATCIQRLNTETNNQSLQWDPSGALVFDSKSPTDFPGFLVNLNLTSFGRVIG